VNWTKPENSGININQICLLNQAGVYLQNISASTQNQFTPLNWLSAVPGIYRYGYTFTVDMSGFPTKISTMHTIEIKAHSPIAVINQSSSGIGDPYHTSNTFSGIAPDVKLAMLRCEWESEIIAAMNWLKNNAKSYNITVVSISLTIPSLAILDLTNQLVEKGLVLVCCAGNDYVGGNFAGSYENAPGSAELAISVGAISRDNSVTSYSAQGGLTRNGQVIKPDIMAPGGEITGRYDLNTPLLTADCNSGEFLYEYAIANNQPLVVKRLPERAVNDTTFVIGTSYAAPIVAAIIMLMMEKMGGMDVWNYSKSDVLRIKNALLLTAAETAPNPRIGYDGNYSPSLDRGGKDVHEGYGMMVPVSALEMIAPALQNNFSIIKTLASAENTTDNMKYSYRFPASHAIRYHVKPTNYYQITLEMDPGLDADLYIYSVSPNAYGEPTIIHKSTSSQFGGQEYIKGVKITSEQDVFIVVKAARGIGEFNLTVGHELDLVPPKVASVFYPNPKIFYSSPLIPSLYAEDDQTAIVSVKIYAANKDQGPLSTCTKPFIWTFPYSTELFWDFTSLEDGWYSILFSFFDGNGNSLNSSVIEIGVDNQMPQLARFIRPEEFTYIHGYINFEFESVDIFSGIYRLQLFLVEEDSDVVIFSEFFGNKNGYDDSYQNYRYIKRSFQYPTKQSMDGARIFYLVAEDRATNQNTTFGFMLFIHNKVLLQRELIVLSIIGVIGLFAVNELVKKFFIKVDLLETYDNVRQLPQKLSRFLNKDRNRNRYEEN
jgi:hypothetical protein